MACSGCYRPPLSGLGDSGVKEGGTVLGWMIGVPLVYWWIVKQHPANRQPRRRLSGLGGTENQHAHKAVQSFAMAAKRAREAANHAPHGCDRAQAYWDSAQAHFSRGYSDREWAKGTEKAEKAADKASWALDYYGTKYREHCRVTRKPRRGGGD